MWKYSTSPSHFLEALNMGVFSDQFSSVTRKGAVTAVEDLQFQQNFPVLYAMMAVLVDDDGKPRQGCTLTLVCEDGMVKLGLNERNHELSLWTSSESLSGAFTVMEEALNERPPRWRKKSWDGKRK